MSEPTTDKMKAWETVRDFLDMTIVPAAESQHYAALQQLRPDDGAEIINERVEALADFENDIEPQVYNSTKRRIATLETIRKALSQPPQTVPDGDDVGVRWMPIETAPKGGRVFISRDKTKPWITFEAAIFAERESWEIPQRYYVIQNMTTDEPIDDDWSHLEWKPLPAPPAAMSKVGE